MALLEREHTAYAQHEVLKLQQLQGFVLVASETMEHASRQLRLIASQQSHHFVLSLATMNHQGKPGLHRPSHLLLKGLQLLLLELATPVIVEAHLTDGDELWRVEVDELVDGIELLLPVGLHLFWVQAHHGIEEARMLPTQMDDAGRRR